MAFMPNHGVYFIYVQEKKNTKKGFIFLILLLGSNIAYKYFMLTIWQPSGGKCKSGIPGFQITHYWCAMKDHHNRILGCTHCEPKPRQGLLSPITCWACKVCCG